MPRRRLREIIKLKHPLCQLADQIEWSVFEDKLGQFYIKHKAEHADGVSAIDTELEELWGVLARAVGRAVGMPAGDAAGLPGLGAIYGVITATTLIWLLRKKPQGDDESLV